MLNNIPNKKYMRSKYYTYIVKNAVCSLRDDGDDYIIMAIINGSDHIPPPPWKSPALSANAAPI